MATWQSELAIELKSIAKGRLEAGESVDDLNFFIKQLEETEVDKWRAIGELNQLGLAYWAAHVESESFHKRAELANKTEQEPKDE